MIEKAGREFEKHGNHVAAEAMKLFIKKINTLKKASPWDVSVFVKESKAAMNEAKKELGTQSSLIKTSFVSMNEVLSQISTQEEKRGKSMSFFDTTKKWCEVDNTLEMLSKYGKP